jgi:hypothetical protein
MTGVRPLGESTVRVLRHELRAEHDVTAQPVAVEITFAGPAPPGWALRPVRPALAVVTGPPAADGPAAPTVRISATDPRLRARLAAPDAVVELDRPVVVHAFVPLPATLEVRLVTPTGTPSAGRAVTVKASTGAVVTLPAVADRPGLYRSEATAWSHPFHPLDIQVEGVTLRRATVDIAAATTRLRLVDPT